MRSHEQVLFGGPNIEARCHPMYTAFKHAKHQAYTTVTSRARLIAGPIIRARFVPAPRISSAFVVVALHR